MMPPWAAAVVAAAIVLSGRHAFRKLGTRRIAQYEKRLADRLEAGEDRYFEELRDLEAYDPRRRSRRFHMIVELLEVALAFALLFLLLADLRA